MNREQVVECLEGWMAHARQGNTYKYRRELLRSFNRNFPIRNKNEIIKSKKIKNFFRKYYASKVEFSSQKTLLLLRKGMSIEAIAKERSLKSIIIWEHIINLVEHGRVAVWSILPKRKIVYLLQKMKDVKNHPLKWVAGRWMVLEHAQGLCLPYLTTKVTSFSKHNPGHINEPLKQIKERIYDKQITYDEIACVRAHLKMKENVKNSRTKVGSVLSSGARSKIKFASSKTEFLNASRILKILGVSRTKVWSLRKQNFRCIKRKNKRRYR